jgi:hypothetical protein
MSLAVSLKVKLLDPRKVNYEPHQFRRFNYGGIVMGKKKLTPKQKVEAIQKTRDFIWDFQRENFDADIEAPILAMDKILVNAQKKALAPTKSIKQKG